MFAKNILPYKCQYINIQKPKDNKNLQLWIVPKSG